MTPVEELVDAARIVREYAEDADVGVVVHPPSWRWVNMFGPVIAEPLADLFEQGAKEAEQIEPDPWLLKVARVIRSQHEAMRGGEA